jgi:hypothetical protein
MKERPILFSAPMVPLMLVDAKTQTRRIAKWSPREPDLNLAFSGLEAGLYIDGDPSSGWVLRSRDGSGCWNDRTHPLPCPYGVAGDRLWVRETHCVFSVGEGMDRPVPDCVAYRSTCDEDGCFDYTNGRGEILNLKVTKWSPAIHMPRWASRIALEVTKVRVERLHAITEDDACAEGARRFDDIPDPHPYGKGARWSMESPTTTDQCLGTARFAFANLWNKLHGEDAWDANPWVWVVSFRRVVQGAEINAEALA